MGIPDAPNCAQLKRKDVAKEFGVQSICFIKIEGGVLEFGTSVGKTGKKWDGVPAFPEIPVDELKIAFESSSAIYTIFWQQRSSDFIATTDFVAPEYARAYKNVRKDDESFCSRSREFKIPAFGNGYIQTTAREATMSTCKNASTNPDMKRKDVCKEFGIDEISWIPCHDGVLEYGKDKNFASA